MLEEFVFLDGHSRRCIGWALHRSLHAELTLAALRMALGQRHLRPGIVHHSDRGVQYACRDDVALLEQHGFRISMSRAGNPYDNAQAESFLKTLKYEEVYRFEYRNFHEAHTRIGEFIETVYNTKRLHSALGSATGRVRTERPMSFLRHGESIPPMSANKTGKEVRPLPPTHRQNEFQPAIPWQGCSPAEPRLRFTGQRPSSAPMPCPDNLFAANGFTVLVLCLSPGVHPREKEENGKQKGGHDVSCPYGGDGDAATGSG